MIPTQYREVGKRGEDPCLVYAKQRVQRKKREWLVLSPRGRAASWLFPLVPFGSSTQLGGPDAISHGWMENTVSSFMVENLLSMCF